MATTSAEASAPTGAQARARGELGEFAHAPERMAEQTNDGERGRVPADYGDDDGAPIGPSEEEEAAFLAEDSSGDFPSTSESQTPSLGGASFGPAGEGDFYSAAASALASTARAEADLAEVPAGPLPSLEDLRGRISPEILGLMEELFRAKLTRVQRVNKRDLKEPKSSR